MTSRYEDLNLSWVTSELVVGGRFPIEAAEHLAQRLGIRHVVDVRVECVDDERVLREHGITLLHLPTVDMRAISLTTLHEGVAWVRERLARGEKVFIHCEYGIGRSVLLTLCVLVAEGHSPMEALTLTKKTRSRMCPSESQLGAFVAYCEQWRQTQGARWEVPSFDELVAIVYHSGWTLPPPE